ncbi:MAG: hypothetical protein IPG02_19160 [Ignavibacteria bacterium]|nr:hypothetical protein [Ignavibacteria bacterium]
MTLILAGPLISWNNSFSQNDTALTRSRADNPVTLRNYVVDETGTLTNA